MRPKLQLPEVEADQRCTEHRQRDHRADDGVDGEEGDQRLGDRPQHRAEGHELHRRADEDQQEVRRAAGEGVDVLADALVGVVDVLALVELVITSLAEVTVEEAAGEPAPPLVGEGVTQEVIAGVDRHRDAQHQQRRLHRGPEAVAVLPGQRGHHFAGAVVEQHRQLRVGQHQQHQAGEQRPRPALAVAQPVGPGHGHELLPGGQRQPGRHPTTRPG
jgi:hypothetical protein